MTGEMSWIDQDGTDQDGDCWYIHAAIAKALGGELHHFDKYQGPYIRVGADKLWITPDDDSPEYAARIYNESTGFASSSFPVYSSETAWLATWSAREVVRSS